MWLPFINTDTDNSDYDSVFSWEEEPMDTPVLKVFLMFKILLINLIFGCVFTIICFKIKRYVGKVFSGLLCGLCDDCDCDYDGSLPTRSGKRQLVVDRKVKMSSENVSSLYRLWQVCEGFYSNKKLVKSVFALLIGFTIGYLLFATENPKSEHEQPLITPIYSLNINLTDFENKKRIFFVMPTPPSGIQNARLTRIAQSLFPSRNFVTWVIVSTDPVSKYFWNAHSTEHWNSRQISAWKSNESRILVHLDDLHTTVSRYGIPFVIISGHEVHHMNRGFTSSQWMQPNVLHLVKAYQVGISWVVKTFRHGIIIAGLEDATYNANLFREVQTTTMISAWPTAFDPRYRFSLSTPLLRKATNTLEGYFVGGKTRANEMPLQYASYAVKMSLARKLHKANELWKLSFDFVYSSRDLGLTKYDIQPLARNCSEVYVWKVSTSFSHATVINQQKIPFKFKWLGSNIPKLHQLINKWFTRDLKM